MKNKTRLMPILFIIAVLILTACGKTNNAGKEVDDAVASEKGTDEASGTSENEQKEVDNAIFNPALAEGTGGELELLFTNDDPGYKNDMDGFILKVDAYQVLKVSKIDEREQRRFGGNSDGYIISFKVSAENTLDKTIYYGPLLTLKGNDLDKIIGSDGLHYIPEAYHWQKLQANLNRE